MQKFLPLLMFTYLFAHPKNPTVIEGEVDFQTNFQKLEIHLGEQSIIHWENFSIDKNETLHFIQPNKKSAVLNRVIGVNRSHLLGTLEANGKIFLVNPNGIVFGENSYINVGGLIASTLDVQNNAFKKLQLLYFTGNSQEKIIHNGIIQSEEDVFLIGYTVENSGSIDSAKGEVGCVNYEHFVAPEEGFYIKPQDGSDFLEDYYSHAFSHPVGDAMEFDGQNLLLNPSE